MQKPLRFSLLGLLAVQLALGLSLRGAGTTYALPHTTRGRLKQTVQSRQCHYQVQEVQSPNPGTVGNGLGGIAALSAHDIWAVGTFTNTSSSQTTFLQTLIEHWDGSRWSVVPSPNPGSFENDLNEVEAISANNIWVVGSFLTLEGPVQTLIEHWDGSRWSVVPSPNPGSSQNFLGGIEAISANDIWVVGSFKNALDSAPQTLIEHWDGSRWSVVPSPNPGVYENSLNGIAALSANDIWAVGSFQNAVGVQTLIEHWNGSRWNVVPGPNPGSSLNFLNGIAALSANDIWVVGNFQNAGDSARQTLIEHWNGSRWNVVPSPNVGINSLSGRSANDIWVVGSTENTNGPVQTLIEHWNGSRWNVVPSPNPGSSQNFLVGIEAISANNIWAVGSFQNLLYGPSSTLIEHITT